MRRLLLAAALAAIAAPALADGPRTLAWPGKPERAPAAGPVQEGGDTQWLFSQFLPETQAAAAPACACCKG